MKIKTQFILSLALFSVVLLIIGGSYFFVNQEQQRLDRQNVIAVSIETGYTQLGFLGDKYLLNRDGASRSSWEGKYAEISSALGTIDTSDPEISSLVAAITSNKNDLYTSFEDIAKTIDTGLPADPTGLQTFVTNSWNRLQTPTQSIVSDSELLAGRFVTGGDTLQRQLVLLTIFILFLVIAYFIVNYFLFNRRVLHSLAQLQTSARFVGAGNLDYVLPSNYDDEVGALARSFNKMTADLKAITVSKEDLEKESIKRAEVEEELRITNDQLLVANENLHENAGKLGQEIQERSASEERFRGLFEKAPYAVALSSVPEGRYADVNDAFIKMTGFSRREIIGKTSIDLGLFPDPSSRARAVAGLKEKNSVETRIVSTTIEPVTLGGQNFWLAMQMDITERKKAEEALRQSYEELERINRAAVGRELRMIELKKEINRYYIATGQPQRYMLDLDEDK